MLSKPNLTEEEQRSKFYKLCSSGYGRLFNKVITKGQWYREVAVFFRECGMHKDANEMEFHAELWERENGTKDNMEDLPF